MLLDCNIFNQPCVPVHYLFILGDSPAGIAGWLENPVTNNG